MGEKKPYDTESIKRTKGRIWNYLIWGSISWPFLLLDGLREGDRRVREYFSGEN